MRQVFIPSLDRSSSAIGFGCASLGSRISPRSGARALANAFALGVTWYDVAPPYGDGHAEDLLGTFAKGRRDDIIICTKFGIARPRISQRQRLVRPLARVAVKLLPRLRSAIRRVRPAEPRVRIEPHMIQATVEESLRRLGVDHLDVLALHEPSLEEAVDAQIFDEMDRLRQRGLVRALSIAGCPGAIRAAFAAGRRVEFAQFPQADGAGRPADLRRALASDGAPQFITHGVFAPLALGQAPAAEAASHQLDELARQLSLAPDEAQAARLLYRGLCANPDGVVIASMFQTRHIELNCAVAALAVPGA